MPETQRRSPNLRHAFLFAACLLLTCPLAARAVSPPRQTGGQEEEEVVRPLRRPGRFKSFGRNLLGFLRCKAANVRKRQELLEYGPQFPKRYDPSDFSFEALVGASWPMVIEYELERQGTAVVTIQVMGADPFTQTLRGEGMGERRTARFTLLAYPGAVPLPALISLKATRDGTRGTERAEFNFLGAGAGDDAVGALPKGTSGLEVAALGPLPPGVIGSAAPQLSCAMKLCNSKLSLTNGGYVYSFEVVAGGRFYRWAAKIETHLNRGKSGLTDSVKDLDGEVRRIGPNQTIERPWDGRNSKGRRVRPGRYWVFVMAWRSGSSIGHWNASNNSPHIIIN